MLDRDSGRFAPLVFAGEAVAAEAPHSEDPLVTIDFRFVPGGFVWVR